MESVAVVWWRPHPLPGGGSQAIRGNVEAFARAGCDVDFYYIDEADRLRERASEYDLVFTGSVTLPSRLGA